MLAFYFMSIGPFGADIEQIPDLTLKIQSQGYFENRPKSNQVIYRSMPSILPKMKKNLTTKSATSIRTCTKKQNAAPSMPGWLDELFLTTPLGTKLYIISIKIWKLSYRKMHLKNPPTKWQPSYSGLDVVNMTGSTAPGPPAKFLITIPTSNPVGLRYP